MTGRGFAQANEIQAGLDAMAKAYNYARFKSINRVDWPRRAVQFTVDFALVKDVRAGYVEHCLLPEKRERKEWK